MKKYISIVIKVSILNMFSLLNVNKAVKEREEREGRGETERERKGERGRKKKEQMKIQNIPSALHWVDIL